MKKSIIEKLKKNKNKTCTIRLCLVREKKIERESRREKNEEK